MYKIAWGTVVRERGVDPLAMMTVSKSPEHIVYAESTVIFFVGTPFIVWILFLPQKKICERESRVEEFFLDGKSGTSRKSQPCSLNFNYWWECEELVFTFNLYVAKCWHHKTLRTRARLFITMHIGLFRCFFLQTAFSSLQRESDLSPPIQGSYTMDLHSQDQ